jgi:hypothetical protein
MFANISKMKPLMNEGVIEAHLDWLNQTLIYSSLDCNILTNQQIITGKHHIYLKL